ncbi:MAG: YgjV family protein [Oscillospiraceae bacterium]|nr:YgjV family protein [Oscillospiraceae bacterium]
MADQRFLLAGNAVSFLAACFTLASAWSRDRRRIYGFQAWQCLLLAAANVLFGSISGVTTFLLCTLRNLLLARDRFTKRRCAFFVAAVALLGLAANNRGLVGLIPVVTTAVYTVACLYVRRTRAIKANIIVNLLLWAVYDLFIMDFVSCAVDSVSAAAAFLSLFRRDAKDTAGAE